jgi:hypothetical protein
MNILCKIGKHEWDGCQCKVCEKKRDEGHDWSKNCERCERCHATRENIHDWDGCFCLKCSAEHHSWKGGRCEQCGCRQKVSVFFDPAHLAEDGRSLGLQVKVATYYYNANEARKVLADLASQVGRDGHALGQHIYFLTHSGPVEITDEDAVEILGTLGTLAQNSMIFDLMAGS